MITELTGLVIGYGSIGRRHVQALSERTPALAIVETNEAARTQAKLDYPAAQVVDRLETLDAAEFPWPASLAVIATWGPSHAAIFHALADRGVRHILCEKPLASSVAQAHEMVQRAEQQQIALGVHHFIRYTRLAAALRRFAAEHELGEPVAVVLEGGAACLVTNGIHWIDFASELFGAAPRRVISTAYGEQINPRSPDLMLYGGTAVWSFAGEREAVISFTNRSSVALKARIYFRDAIAETDSDVSQLVIRGRDQQALARFPAITRTGPATEPLFAGRLPEMLGFAEAQRAALDEVASGAVRTSPASIGVGTVTACIGALLAAREQQAIELPIDPLSGWGQELWPIS